MINSRVISGVCPIDNRPGHVCGDDHMRIGPVDLTALEGTTVANEPVDLREYTYLIGNMETTAMLTPKMAERLGAVPVGETPEAENGGNTMAQRQAQLGTTDMADADANGVNTEGSEAYSKVRNARNKNK